MPDPFSQLLELRRGEAATRQLAKLPADFYGATATYLAEVRRSYEADLRENPSGRKGEISRQTYQRASQAARDIVEGRAQKILAAAFQASVGGARELPNSLPEERALFDRLLAAFVDHRQHAAPYLESAAGPSAPGPSAPVRAPDPPVSSPAPAAPAGGTPGRAPAGLVYVRILKDSPAIEVGTERVELRADDVLSLPGEKARILIDAKIAEPVGPVPPRAVT